MESRIQNIRNYFNEDKKRFLLSFNTTMKTIIKQETTAPIETTKKLDKPLMMKNILYYKENSNKSTLKKPKAPFVSHGNIDDYEKELMGLHC